MYTFISQKGVSIIFAVFTLLLLSIVGFTIFSLVSSDIESAASKVNLDRALYIAEAGIQIGAQALKGVGGTTYSRTVYLEGYDYAGSTGVDNPFKACLHGTDWNSQDEAKCTLPLTSGAYVSVWNFKQRRNLRRLNIKNIKIRMKARRDGDALPAPRIQFKYSTDGGSNWVDLGDPYDISSSWEYYESSVPMPSSLNNWDTFMANDGDRFMVRAFQKNSPAKKCLIDWLCIKAEVEGATMLADTSGIFPPNFLPAPLGDGRILSIEVVDEQSGVHLNYATEDLLKWLMYFNGVPEVTAGTLARRIVTYRRSNPFDSVEELKDVNGMTNEYYEMIDQDVTVSSWVNDAVTRPGTPQNPKSRPPININTASANVLKAIFKCALPDMGWNEFRNKIEEKLVPNIINQRTAQPFTHMFSCYTTQASTRDITSFSGFIEEQKSYIETEAKRHAIRANADASYYNRDISNDWTGTDETAAEFNYTSDMITITAVGECRGVTRKITAVYDPADGTITSWREVR